MAKDKEKRIVVDVPPEVHREAKVQAAQSGRTLSDVIRDLLFGWLKQSKEQPTEK